MEIKITYPHIEKGRLIGKHILTFVKWIFLLAAFICPIVNIAVGGKAWSVIVLMCLYMVHTLILSPDLVEYNRISQVIKFVFLLCTLLILIEFLLIPGWAGFATTVITCCGLIFSGILFFTDFNRQKKNMFPLFWLIGISLIRASVGILLSSGEEWASFMLMEVLSILLFLLFLAILKKDLMRELRCRFHTR